MEGKIHSQPSSAPNKPSVCIGTLSSDLSTIYLLIGLDLPYSSLLALWLIEQQLFIFHNVANAFFTLSLISLAPLKGKDP